MVISTASFLSSLRASWPGMLMCESALAANVYGVLPAGGWRTSSIVLMLFHQCVGARSSDLVTLSYVLMIAYDCGVLAVFCCRHCPAADTDPSSTCLQHT